MLACEVDAAFRLGKRVDEAYLSGCVQCERSALPLVEPPALCDAAFKSAGQFREDLPGLIERRRRALLLTHTLERRGVRSDRVGGECASVGGDDARIGCEPLDGQIGRDMAAQLIFQPKSRTGL